MKLLSQWIFLDTADIRKYFTGEEYKALISTLSVEATEMQKKMVMRLLKSI